MKMKRLLVVVGVSAMLMLAWSMGRVQGQIEQVKAQDKVLFASADHANFKSTAPGVSSAAIWGDGDKGAHATFTKFAPGQDNGWHTHTNDVWIVGIKGAYVYKDDAGEKRIGRAFSCVFPADTNTGAAEMRKRAPFSMKRVLGNLI
jgi:quercetin dioxygenase-like cupin family protein